MSHFNQGVYHPINREKYFGDVPKYLSGWELNAFKKLDVNPRVTRWGANSLFIPYNFLLEQKNHRYYLDLYVEMLNRNNNLEKFLIEIKPDKQLFLPERPKKSTPKAMKNYNYSLFTYAKNCDKWIAANSYARSMGATFFLMSETGFYILVSPVKVNNQVMLRKVANNNIF